VGTRYQGITRAVYGSEACCKTAGLAAFSNTDLNRTLYLVEFSEKIPGRFVENQQPVLINPARPINKRLLYIKRHC